VNSVLSKEVRKTAFRGLPSDRVVHIGRYKLWKLEGQRRETAVAVALFTACVLIPKAD
jgi:hypothetical protein